MFRALGMVVTRAWPLLLVGWAVAVVSCLLVAPDWSSVAAGGVFNFLPERATSRRAERLLERAFPEASADSAVVIVASRDDRELTAADESFVRDRLLPGLQEIERRVERAGDGDPDDPDRPEVVRIRSLDEEVARPIVISDDRRATLVQVELSANYMQRTNRVVVDPVRDLLGRLRRDGEVPEGLDLTLTGSAVIGHDMNEEELKSARTIERWTVWWVLLLLLIVHRAPLLALVQVLTITAAMEVAIALLALMARAGWIDLFEGLDIYTTVLVYGAGIDYSLFLIARYRERIERGQPPRRAVAGAIGRGGLAVAISAGTAIVAVGALSFTEFDMFRQAGTTIPFGLFVMLVASLTLTPALLLLLGRRAVWPSRAGRGGGGWLGRIGRGDPLEPAWTALGRWLERRPGLSWAVAVLAMLPAAAVGALKHNELSYAPLTELPGDAPSVRAIADLQRHFPAGTAGQLSVVLRSDTADFGGGAGVAAIAALTDRLLEQKQELGIAYVRSVTAPFGAESSAAEERAAADDSPVGKAITGLVSRAAENILPTGARAMADEALRRRAIAEYVGRVEHEGGVTLLVVVPSFDPFTAEALDRVGLLEAAVEEALPEDLGHVEVTVAGAPSSLRDLRAVSTADRRRVYVLGSVGVLLVLVVLLRRVAISIYLIATVVLSYLVTLGTTVLLFRWLQGDGYRGIDWTVPLFLFTLMMAVGADYNVFLLTRVDEEQDAHGAVGGIAEALRRTGGIISGCGLIMAGTFAALLWGGTLASLYELGFALAFGVLLDTFVIRPLLVPSWLILIHDGRLGPLSRLLGGRADRAPRPEAEEEPEPKKEEPAQEPVGAPSSE